MQSTTKYQQDSDFYQEFAEEKLSKGVPTDVAKWADVWMSFVSWFKACHGAEHLPKKLEARGKFETDVFRAKLEKGTWKGWLLCN